MSRVENYHYYKDRQRCVHCHKQDAYTLAGRSYCYECVSAYGEYRRKYEMTHAQNISTHKKQQRQNWIVQGVCSRCGKRPADNGYKTCAYCRAYSRKKKWEESRRNGQPTITDKREWSENGFCYHCGAPVKDGFTLTGHPIRICERCYENVKRGGELGLKAIKDRFNGKMVFIDSNMVSISKEHRTNGAGAAYQEQRTC